MSEKELNQENIEVEVKIDNPPIDNEPKVEETPRKEEKVSKRQIAKAKRLEKARAKMFAEQDIKYSGALSYRYLRIIAWICLALTQVVISFRIITVATKTVYLDDIGLEAISFFGNLATPLFLVASFGILYSRSKTWRYMILFYGGLFLGVAIGVISIYHLYVTRLLNLIDPKGELSGVVALLVAEKAQVNAFTDLFLMTCINFFINYEPKKYFKTKKKKKLFRWMVVLPIAYLLTSHVIKGVANFPTTDFFIPFELSPFLATKSIFIHLIFIGVALWFKYRERLYIKLGGNKEGYNKFLKTNRNSLDYSIMLVKFFAIAAAVDFVCYLVIGIGLTIYFDSSESIPLVLETLTGLGFGQTFSLIVIAPLIMLYSYTKDHKNSTLNVVIPIAGIGLIVFIYFQMIYIIIYNYLARGAA